MSLLRLFVAVVTVAALFAPLVHSQTIPVNKINFTGNGSIPSLAPSCHPNSTTIGLSWCQYNNPFILSDFLSRNSTEITAGPSSSMSSGPFKLNVYCESDDDPHALCSGVQKVSAGSFGIGDRFDEAYDSNFTNYVVFVDLDGQVLFVNFNNNTMAQSLKIDMSNVTFIDVGHLYSRTIPNVGDVTNMLLIVANKTSAGLVTIDGETGNVIGPCFIFSQAGDVSGGYKALNLSLEIVKFATGDPFTKDETINLIWATSSNWTENIRYYQPGVEPQWYDNYITLYDLYSVPTPQAVVPGYIAKCPNGPPTRYEAGLRLLSVDTLRFDVVHNRISNKTYVIAYSSRIVNLYTLDYDESNAQQQGNITFYAELVPLVPYWCNNATIFNATQNKTVPVVRYPSSVYCVPDDDDGVIDVASIFAPDTFVNVGSYDMDVFIVVGVRNSTSSRIEVRGMDEVAFYNGTFDNPLALPSFFGTPAYPCNFDTEVYVYGYSSCVGRACCRNRTHSTFFLTDQSKGVKTVTPNLTSAVARSVRALNQPSSYNMSKINTTGLGNITKQLNFSTDDVPLPMITSNYIQLFVATDRTVHVFIIFANSTDANGVYLAMEKSNEVHFLGTVTDLYTSVNAQHLFAAVSRQKWELDAQTRYKEVCDALALKPADPFLSPFAPQCQAQPGQEVNLNSFTQYTSSCTFAVYCPSLAQQAVKFPPDGYYAERPAVVKKCPPGYFCVSGQQQRCPPGFYCDEAGLSWPKRCTSPVGYSSTCSSYGQVTPTPCPPGVVCALAHIPGLPAPPGYMVPAPPALRLDFDSCAPGMWCALGAQAAYNGSGVTNTTFVCPANTFCANSSVLEPTICECVNGVIPDAAGDSVACDQRTLYCPAGTTNVSWCPSGYYCTDPNTMVSCVQTQYCPPGTFAPQLCAAGSYCPEPSSMLPCPEGHFCPQGAVTPTACNFLTICPAGSSAQSRSFLAPVIVVAIVIGLLALFYIFSKAQERDQHRIEEQMKTSNRPPTAPGGSPKNSGKERLLSEDDVAETELSESSVSHGGRASVPTSRFVTPTIEFRGMGLTLAVGEAKGKKVLDDVSGVIAPGSFVAVMGPSGSGKSTFMHTLAGKAFYGTRSGQVLVNGDEVDLNQFSKVVGFVKQDDIMHREMTVAETILFNAQMRYDPLSADKPEGIANSLLKALDLSHVRDIRIGDEKKRGISGGQRKRVNIGMEMAALPALLFLDEPTSGLDSSSSMTVCGCLRDMAHSGISVIAVIHQPRYEIFNMFHRVLLLAKGGKLVYYGAPDKALAYFEQVLKLKCPEHVNPPDFFMDVISGENDAGLTVDEMVEKWKAHCAADREQQQQDSVHHDQTHSVNKDVDSSSRGATSTSSAAVPVINGAALAAEASKKQVAGFLQQLIYFTQRSVVQISRDLIWFFTDLLLTLVAGFFLGLVFSQSEYLPPLPNQIINKSLSAFNGNAPPSLSQFFNRPIDDPIISEASLTCMAVGMTGVTAALRVFGPEQIVYWREASAGMSTVAYFTAKNITHLFFIIFSPFLYLAPFLTFVSARASFLAYYRVVVVVQFATTGLGYLVSIVSPSGLSQLAGVVAVLVFSMFGGSRPTLVEIKKMFPLLQLMPYMSYVRWGQEALYIAEITEWSHIQGVDINPSLELFDYHLDDYNFCMWLTVAFGVLFRVIALVAMLVMHRDQKH